MTKISTYFIALCLLLGLMACSESKSERRHKQKFSAKAVVKTDSVLTAKPKRPAYQLSNEDLVFSLRTANGRLLSVCIDKDDRYMVYRYGTDQKIELEYPAQKNKSSFGKFAYSGWERHGGVQNEGMNLNYLAFSIGKYKYVVYDTYHAVGDVKRTGIKVMDTVTNKTTNINGIYESIKGSLADLRMKDMVKKGDELYD